MVRLIDIGHKMTRLVDTRHKMTRLSVMPSTVVRLSRLSPRGATSAAVHMLAPLVMSVRLTRLIYKSRTRLKRVKFRKKMFHHLFLK
jgi:hypothetical protein